MHEFSGSLLHYINNAYIYVYIYFIKTLPSGALSLSPSAGRLVSLLRRERDRKPGIGRSKSVEPLGKARNRASQLTALTSAACIVRSFSVFKYGSCTTVRSGQWYFIFNASMCFSNQLVVWSIFSFVVVDFCLCLFLCMFFFVAIETVMLCNGVGKISLWNEKWPSWQLLYWLLERSNESNIRRTPGHNLLKCTNIAHIEHRLTGEIRYVLAKEENSQLILIIAMFTYTRHDPFAGVSSRCCLIDS